jgi:hypothetical protein
MGVRSYTAAMSTTAARAGGGTRSDAWTRLSRYASAERALVLLVALSAGIAFWLAWRPVDHLVTHTMSDDAFYYFQTARTIADGGGVSVDGETWANGFHPIWLLMLVPVYWLGAGDETAINIALTMSAAAVSLSGLVLYATARRMGISEIASLAATALYLLHPVVTYMSVNGLETGIGLAAFVVFAYVFVCCWQESSATSAMFVSLAAGVLVLARTDYGIVAAVGLAALVLRTGAEPARMAALVMPAIAITAPWFAWNIVVFDTPLQGSAGAIPYVAHQLFPSPDASAGEIVRHGARQLQDGGYDVLPAQYFAWHADGAHAAAWIVVGLVAATGALVMLSRTPARIQAFGILLVLALGLAAQFFVHAGLRWYLREWYLAGVFPLLALAFALLLDALSSWRAGIVAAMCVAAFVAVTTVMKARETYGDGWYPVQADLLAASRWIKEETPADARVGAFNSGIIGYFSGRTTVNLDGVMNPDALEAIRDRRVAEYMSEREIDYVADFQYYPYWLYRPFLGEELRAAEVARFDTVATFQGPVLVLELARQ